MSLQSPRTSRTSSPTFNISAAASSARAAAAEETPSQPVQASPLFAAQDAQKPPRNKDIPPRFHAILKRVSMLAAGSFPPEFKDELHYLNNELKGRFKGFDKYTSKGDNWNVLHVLARNHSAHYQRAIISHMDPQEIALMSQSKTTDTGSILYRSHVKPARLAYWGNAQGNGFHSKQFFMDVMAAYSDFFLVDAYFNAKIKEKGSLTPVRELKRAEFCRYLEMAIKAPENIYSFKLHDFFNLTEMLTSPFRDKEYQSLMHALHSYLKELQPEQIKRRAQRFLKRSGKTLEKDFRLYQGSYVVPHVAAQQNRIASDVADKDL